MRWWWQLAVCTCLMSSALTGVVPTTETMVVTRTDDEVPSTSETVTELTTEEASAPIKMTEMDVKSEITLRYAHTAVVTTVRNPAKKAQEANFRVLLPETAFISGFTMTLDGKSYKAYVKEKEEAKQIYNDAVSQGLGAAHVSTKARDSNHFTVSVNVEPNTVAVFNLTYEELLVRRNGVYNHIINLHPGALVPKLTVTVHVKEGQKLSQLRVPAIRTGNEIDATENDPQNTKAIISKTDNEATITFSSDLAEQQRLIEIYAEKAKQSQERPLGYPSYVYEREQEDKKEGVLGQFVVQYDVERPPNGEILVNDGYFVHFFSPPSLPPLSKHAVFVLDTSGSMMERKISQLISAMDTILGDLGEQDYFNIVEFDSYAKVHELSEAEKSPPPPREHIYGFGAGPEPPALVPPARATPANIARAKTIVSRLVASGGTNIYSALDLALDLIQKGVYTQTAANESTTEVPSKDKESQLEPIIIFLTDGDPTVGESNPKKIISHITEKNSGVNRATIFSLSFGEDADRSFLRKLSLRNEGFMRHIYEAADAALQLRDFYRQVSSPLLAHVKFVYPPSQIKEGSVTKHDYRALYLGSEAVVAGRVADSADQLEPRVEGFCGVQDGGRKKYEIFPKVPTESKRQGYLPLERLWAYLTIQQLLDQKDATDTENKEDGPSKKALDLALKYSFVTPLTSLVVVKPNATSAVDAESVDKQDSPFGLGAPLMAAGHVAPGGSYFLAQRPFAPMALDSYNFASSFAASGPSLDQQLSEDLAEFETEYAAVDTTADPLARYNLTAFPWIVSMLDEATDTISVQSKNVTLKLSTTDAVERAESDTPCARAVGAQGAGAAAEGGLCVYVSRCAAAGAIMADQYADTYCSVDGYAGICCPTSSIEKRRT